MNAIVLNYPQGMKIDYMAEAILPHVYKDAQLAAVKVDRTILGNLPRELKTKDLCLAALETDPRAYHYFPTMNSATT